MRCFFSFLIILFASQISAQNELWTARYNGTGNYQDAATAIAADNFGNVYVTGGSWSPTDYEYLTIKYNSSGDTVWVRRYNGLGPNGGIAKIAVDASGNAYVAGQGIQPGGTYDYLTIKYDSSGDTAWVREYNGPGDTTDCINAITLDNSGNIYVTGMSYGFGTDYDYATVKYRPSGDTVWVRRFDDADHTNDAATAITADNSGNVYVTGWSWGLYGGYNYVTIKYDSSGDTVWTASYNGAGNSLDNATSIAIDDSGNVYVTGYSWGAVDYDYATVKYNSAGDTVWTRIYDGPVSGLDRAFAIAADDSGNAYVTGMSTGSGALTDYATIKYDSSGDTVWVRRYDGTGNSDDEAVAIMPDNSGNVYVTGSSHGAGSSTDYVTIKYNSAGDTSWVIRYDSPFNSGDNPSAMAMDGSGNIYVTGASDGSGTFWDYLTIKYSAVGVEENAPPPGRGVATLQILKNKIYLEMANSENVELKLFNLCGRLQETIYEGALSKGDYTFTPKIRASGIYFVTLLCHSEYNEESNIIKQSKKLILVR